MGYKSTSSHPHLCEGERGEQGTGWMWSRTLDCVLSTAVMLTEGCSPHWWVHSGPNAQHGVHFSRELQSEWSTSLTPQQGGNEARRGRETAAQSESEELFQASWFWKKKSCSFSLRRRSVTDSGSRFKSYWRWTWNTSGSGWTDEQLHICVFLTQKISGSLIKKSKIQACVHQTLVRVEN